MNIRILITGIFMLNMFCASYAQSLSRATFAGLSANYKSAQGGSSSNSMGEAFAGHLTSGNAIITQGFEQPDIQINTDSVSLNGFCAAQTPVVYFSAYGYVDSVNVFTAQISDSTGDFTNAVNIGTTSSTLSGSIACMLPRGVSTGYHYKIRVNGSAPYFTGKPTITDITITNCNVISYEKPLSLKLIPKTNQYSRAALGYTIPETAPGDFVVLEKSNDGFNFESVTTINTGNGGQGKYTDDLVANEIWYYRLKLTSGTGTEMVSDVVAVGAAYFKISIYPNPVVEELHVNFGVNNDDVKIVLTDMLGQRIYSSTLQNEADKEIDMHGFTAGIYIITCYTSSGKTSQRIIKQ